LCSKLLVIVVYMAATAILSLSSYFTSYPQDFSGPFNFPDMINPTILLLSFVVSIFCMKALALGPTLNILSFLSIFIPALINTYRYPPIEDGAYFILRYGNNHFIGNSHFPEPPASFIFIFTFAFMALFAGFKRFNKSSRTKIYGIIISFICSYLFVKLTTQILYSVL